MKNKAKQTAKEFMQSFNIKKPSENNMRKALEKQGYVVVEFDSADNTEDVDVLIREFSLTDFVRNSKGFTYADSSCRLVFINENLSEEERLIVLCHEQGHISGGHFGEAGIIGRDVMQEYEANEFAHYLLNPTFGTKLYFGRKPLIIAAAVITAAAVIIGHTVQNTLYGEYYITETGKKYHRADCALVKNKDNVRRITAEELKNGVYSPCGMCLPDGKEDDR